MSPSRRSSASQTCLLLGRWNGSPACGSTIMQQSLHVFDSGRESQRPNAGCFAVEGHHIFPPRDAVLKDEDLALSFSPQVHQLVARAPQVAEVASFEGSFTVFHSKSPCPGDTK